MSSTNQKCVPYVHNKTSNAVKLPSRILELLENSKSQDIRNMYYGGYSSSSHSINNIFKYCGHSVKNGRPLDKVMIIMAGQSGAGKSSTINCLFDDPNLCAVSSKSSETSEVTEYRKTLFVTEEKPTLQADLSFVDIPGTLDVDSSKEALNFHKIKLFREQDPALATRTSGKAKALNMAGFSCRKNVYPNLVLLVLRPDPRMSGPDSFFMKTLKALKEYNIVDTKHPNLLVVMTHAMSFPRKTYSKKVAEITELVQACISIVFSIRDVQVVFVENNAEEYCDKPDGSDFYELPNGELSHHNLMQAIIELFKRNSDHLGRLLCGWYFKSTCPDRKSKAEAILFKGGNSIATAEDLEKAVNKLVELGITSDYESTATSTVKPMHHLESLGYGYCPVTETIKHTNVFAYNEKEMQKIQIEDTTFKLPNCITPYAKSTTRFTRLSFYDQESYQEHRKKQYGLSLDIPLVVGVGATGRWVKSTTAINSETLISVVFEKQLATLKVNDPESQRKQPKLLEELQRLPNCYDEETRVAFHDFFSKWGTHIISEQHVGGSIRLDLTIQASQIGEQNLQDIENKVKVIFETLCVVKPKTISNDVETTLKSIGVQSECLVISGGDPPNIMSLQNFTNEMFQHWVTSINSKPTELEYNFKLFPYYHFVANGPQCTALKEATIGFLKNSQIGQLQTKRDEVGQKIMEDVKSEAASSCFPSFTQVRLSNGNNKPITTLMARDKLLAINHNSKGKHPKMISSTFHTFLHRNDEILANFMIMTFSNGKTLVTTPNHLLFCYDGKNSYSKQAFNFICNVDEMLFLNENGDISTPRLIEISTKVYRGVYAPLTNSGTFIADGFVVSCYADVNSFQMAHAVMKPLILWYQYKPQLSKKHLKDGKSRNKYPSDGIHTYPKCLMNIRKFGSFN